jgi:addiction module HigA family antidote
MRWLRLSAFRVSMKSSAGDRAISADAAIRLGKYFGLPAQFWLNLQNDYDLRIAEGSGVGKGIRPCKAAHDAELTSAR